MSNGRFAQTGVLHVCEKRKHGQMKIFIYDLKALTCKFRKFDNYLT